jgi:hypothetical protein
VRLKEGEEHIRSDLVFADGVFSDYADMVLTTKRILFQRCSPQGLLENLGRILAKVPNRNGRWLQPDEFEVDLSRIDRFWSWQPEFSGAPLIEVNNQAFCSFDLTVVTESSWLHVRRSAPMHSIGEHFAAVEAAWKAATSPTPKT